MKRSSRRDADPAASLRPYRDPYTNEGSVGQAVGLCCERRAFNGEGAGTHFQTVITTHTYCGSSWRARMSRAFSGSGGPCRPLWLKRSSRLATWQTRVRCKEKKFEACR